MLAFSFILTILVDIALPIAFIVFLVRRYGTSWKVAFVGAMSFLLIQILYSFVYTPVGDFFASLGLPQPYAPMITLILMLAVLAALQTAARWGAFWYLKMDGEEFGAGLTVGAGNGGVEVFMFGVQIAMLFINIISLSSSGIASLNLPADQAASLQLQLDAFWKLPWYQPLAYTFQGLYSIVSSLLLTMMVWIGWTKKMKMWLGAAFAWQLMSALLIEVLNRLVSVNMMDNLVFQGIMVVVLALNVGILYILYHQDGVGVPPLSKAELTKRKEAAAKAKAAEATRLGAPKPALKPGPKAGPKAALKASRKSVKEEEPEEVEEEEEAEPEEDETDEAEGKQAK